MTSPIITEAVRTLVDRRDLTRIEAAAAMEAIMSGGATSAQIAAFLTALRMKGETVEELATLLDVMRAFGQRVGLPAGTDALDTCGTGGDRACTINASTVAALVAAGAGAKVCKHGNRSQSSQCGSADLLEALSVALTPMGRREDHAGPREVDLGEARAVEEVAVTGSSGITFEVRYADEIAGDENGFESAGEGTTGSGATSVDTEGDEANGVTMLTVGS